MLFLHNVRNLDIRLGSGLRRKRTLCPKPHPCLSPASIPLSLPRHFVPIRCHLRMILDPRHDRAFVWHTVAQLALESELEDPHLAEKRSDGPIRQIALLSLEAPTPSRGRSSEVGRIATTTDFTAASSPEFMATSILSAPSSQKHVLSGGEGSGRTLPRHDWCASHMRPPSPHDQHRDPNLFTGRRSAAHRHLRQRVMVAIVLLPKVSFLTAALHETEPGSTSESKTRQLVLCSGPPAPRLLADSP